MNVFYSNDNGDSTYDNVLKSMITIILSENSNLWPINKSVRRRV